MFRGQKRVRVHSAWQATHAQRARNVRTKRTKRNARNATHHTQASLNFNESVYENKMAMVTAYIKHKKFPLAISSRVYRCLRHPLYTHF